LSELIRLVRQNPRSILLLVLLLGLVHGLVYVFLMPPWQHYDEYNHFQYVWLIAHQPGLPSPGDDNPQMDRWVLESMAAHGFYRRMATRPDLSDPAAKISLGGYTQLGDPPLYYWLASLPARLFPPDQVDGQLYVGRLVSLMLFLVTILAAWGIVGELVSPRSPLRWMAPLSIVLLPAFVDLMTAVNNDVAAVTIFSLFLWGATRLLKRGFNLVDAFWVLASAALVPFIKSTAFIALPLVPIIFFFALFRGRYRRLAWGLTGLVVIALILAVFDWGDAADWGYGFGQTQPTRVLQASAELGRYALRLSAAPPSGKTAPYEIQQLLPLEGLRSLEGKDVTLGGWAWSDRPALLRVTILQFTPSRTWTVVKDYPIDKSPEFWSFSSHIHPVTSRAWVTIVPLQNVNGGQAQVYLDGLVLAEGLRPADAPPQFSDRKAESGIWGGQPFRNFLRNPSLEQAWPRLRNWFNQLGASLFFDFGMTEPSRALYTLLDWRGAGWYYTFSASIMFRTFWARFGWGNVTLLGHKPYRTLFFLTLVGFLGLPFAFARRWKRLPYAVGLVFILALLGAWSLTLMRGSNYVLVARPVLIPAARYAYPAIIPTMLLLSTGWYEVLYGIQKLFKLPVVFGSLVFIAFFVTLDIYSIVSILAFFAS
jgi:hypothetical protein